MTGLPTHLWVGFLFARNDDGTIDRYTDGLDVFGVKEVEVIESKRKPSELIDLIGGVAAYQIWVGDKIKDGDTVGGDAKERIKTKFAESEIGREGTVLRIKY